MVLLPEQTQLSPDVSLSTRALGNIIVVRVFGLAVCDVASLLVTRNDTLRMELTGHVLLVGLVVSCSRSMPQTSCSPKVIVGSATGQARERISIVLVEKVVQLPPGLRYCTVMPPSAPGSPPMISSLW